MGRMTDGDSLAGAAEMDFVATDQLTHTDRVHADLPRWSSADLAMTAENDVIGCRAPRGGCDLFHQRKRGPARCIYLMAVMCLYDLEVISLAELSRHATDNVENRLDSDAEVGRFKNRDSPSRFLDLRQLMITVAGRANDHRYAAMLTYLQPGHRAVGDGEIDEHITGCIEDFADNHGAVTDTDGGSNG